MSAPTRRLGATDLLVAPLVLGGNVFGWTADRDAGFAVLDAFVDAGGTMVDTADSYSHWVPGNRGGESELIIGEWLRRSGKRGRVQIATKTGMGPIDGPALAPARIVEACEASLRRLGVDAIDLYYAHQDDADTPAEAWLEAFGRLHRQGKMRVLGVSNFRALRLKAAVDLGKHDPSLPRVHALQPEYNLVSRRKFEGELQDYCVQENIGVLPYYGLASGFLTGKYRSRDDLGKSVRGGRMADLLDGNGAAVLAVMDEVAAETGASLARIALAWLMAQPGVVAPIASATSAEQLADLVPAMTLALTEDQLARLTDAGA